MQNDNNEEFDFLASVRKDNYADFLTEYYIREQNMHPRVARILAGQVVSGIIKPEDVPKKRITYERALLHNDETDNDQPDNNQTTNENEEK